MLSTAKWRGTLNAFRSAVSYKDVCEAEAKLVEDRAEMQHELEQAQAEVETLRAAGRKFSKAHHWDKAHPDNMDPIVDPQDWAEFDAALAATQAQEVGYA